MELIQNGRKKAIIQERAGSYTVKMYLCEDEEDTKGQSVGGCFSRTYTAAKNRALSWVTHGVLP